MFQKKVLIGVAALLISTQIWATEYQTKDTQSCPQDKKLVCDKSGNLLTGNEITKYPNGQWAEVTYKNGNPDYIKTYYKTGVLASEMKTENGKMKYIEYGEDGKLKPNKNLSKFYYANGNLKEEVNYENGQRNGLTKRYYENGILEAELNYKDGEEDGLQKGYHDNGNLMYEHNFKAGELEGLQKEYDLGGNLLTEMNYKAGKPDGLHKLYIKGKLLMECQYKDGKLVEGSEKFYN